MAKPSLHLYFIACIPPEPIYTEVWEIKKTFEAKFKSKGALNSPPHITLHMPFRLKASKEEQLIEELQTLFGNHAPFGVDFKGFGCFGQKVIYLKIIKSEALTNLHSGVAFLMKKCFQIFNADYKNKGFQPHMTLAFRRLNKENFSKAWAIYGDMAYEKNYISDRIALLKHNGREWEVLESFRLR